MLLLFYKIISFPKTSYTVTYCFVSPLIFSWFYAVFRYRTNDCIIGKFKSKRRNIKTEDL